METAQPKQARIRKYLLNGFLATALIVLVSAVTVVVIARQTGKPVSIFGFSPYVIASDSMAPELKTNSFVIIRKRPFEQAAVGDIVAFIAAGMGGKTALHRVIAINDGKLITKGDNNQQPDGVPVTKDNYLGVAIWHTNLFAK